MTPAAFEALVRDNERGLRQLAYRLLGSVEEMEDALQESCLRAYRSAGTLRDPTTEVASTWLYRIVYRTCIDRLRKRRREESLEKALASVNGAVHTEGAAGDKIDWQIDLERALANLDARSRAVVLLVDVVGFDYEAAGEVLSVPLGTVGSRLNRARSELRALLLPVANERETKEGGRDV